MYYKSNNTVIAQPIFWNVDTDNLKKTITYMLDEIIKGVTSSFFKKQGINDNVVEYNNEKYSDLERIYSMAHDNINSLTKSYITANIALDNILKLESNWNDNGAQVFSIRLVEKCKRILNQLAAEPFICPTACGSIQFEYEKDNGEYLEFEIFEDRIEAYRETLINGEEEILLCGIAANDKMRQMVVDFYGE